MLTEGHGVNGHGSDELMLGLGGVGGLFQTK